MQRHKFKNGFAILAFFAAQTLCLMGCAEDEIRADTESQQPTPTAQAADPVPAVEATQPAAAAPTSTALEARVAELQDRLQGMEQKVTDLQSQLQLAQNGQNAVAAKVDGPQAVLPHPAQNAGRNPEVGFTQDEIVQAYRKAMILFQAQKYPESILAFSAFVEQNPDHVLAGSAQFYLGQAYFEQKEFKLALKEWERVITSYDRSPRVSDTLRQMAQAEDQLKRPKDAATHRQLLTSLFPQSPAARLAMRDSVGPQIDAMVETPSTTESGAPTTAPAQASSPELTPMQESQSILPATEPAAEPVPAAPAPETAPAIE